VRDVAPRLPVLTRATYAHEVRALQDAGADVVVTAEASVAVELAERILKRLGASRKVREGERDRILADFLPS
jgi:monovalent cation:H+ antiporter-2, CPA2 family